MASPKILREAVRLGVAMAESEARLARRAKSSGQLWREIEERADKHLEVLDRLPDRNPPNPPYRPQIDSPPIAP